MKYQSLEDYISTLSESEKKRYELLIEEHRQREVAIRKNCEESRKRLEGLSRNMEAYAETMIEFKRSLNELNTSIREVHSKVFLYTKALSESAAYFGQIYQHYPRSFN